MSQIRRFTTAAAVLFIAAPLAAQSVTSDLNATATVAVSTPVVAVESAPSLAPTVAARAVGVRAAAAMPPIPRPAPGSTGRSPALMIVGGAGLLIGSVVGGNSGQIIMVAGAVVGLYGLWTYLN